MSKSIYISGNSLLAYTSGTPMRGLIRYLINLRPTDLFTIHISEIGLSNEIKQYLKKIEENENVSVVLQKKSVKSQNIKNLIGIKTGNSADGYDFYISPGMPEYFNQNQQPSISFIADLSSINLPKQSSLKWHGNRIFKNTLKWCINSNTKIAAISEFTREELIERDPENKEKYITIYNGIEDFWFDDVYEENELTKKLETKKYWIWWGYMSNRKNIHRLLLAYIKAKEEKYNLPQIVIIGSIAPEQKACKELINLYPHYFELYPFQDTYILKTLVRNSSGLLFPSLYEGFGLPVIETYSQGLPVLHSNTTSLPEIANRLGITIDPYNIEDISNGLIHLSILRQSHEIIAERKKWAANFTYKNASLKLNDIINKLLD